MPRKPGVDARSELRSAARQAQQRSRRGRLCRRPPAELRRRRARVGACRDNQEHEGEDERDFDEWAVGRCHFYIALIAE
jgi:hypothetical protein